MNLTICLLMTRRFLERERIRDLVEGYHGLSDSAFERAFERDKEELRSMGVPVETGSNSALFPDEVGYRIRRRDFELPALEFDAAELTALALASEVWDSSRVGARAVTAVAKLRAAGLEPDTDRVAGFAPSVSAHEPAFEPLWEATLTRRPVRFTYRGVARVVEPWRLALRTGSWYLVGFDRVRGAGRSYKVSRIEDAPVPAGPAWSVPAPDAAVVAAHLDSLAARREVTALVAIREGRAPDLARQAEPADAPVPEGFAAYRVRVGRDAAGDLAAHGADVVVLDPPELRAAVIEHLRVVAAWA